MRRSLLHEQITQHHAAKARARNVCEQEAFIAMVKDSVFETCQLYLNRKIQVTLNCSCFNMYYDLEDRYYSFQKLTVSSNDNISQIVLDIVHEDCINQQNNSILPSEFVDETINYIKTNYSWIDNLSFMKKSDGCIFKIDT